MRVHASRMCVLVLSLAFSAALQAQSQRTFVSSTGNDANPCSRSLPCRNFAAAVAATLSGGEVVVLDSAGYGPVSLTQSVSIVAPAGVYAGISVFSGNGVDINAPSGTIVLRGLTLTNLGTNTRAIAAAAVGYLYVDGCAMSQFSYGVSFLTSGELYMSDSTVRDSYDGVLIQPPTGTAAGWVDHCRIERAQAYGVLVDGTNATGPPTVSIRDTVLSNQGLGVGIQCTAAHVAVKSCLATLAYIGVQVSSGILSVSSTMAAGNSFGFANNGGTFMSSGTNDTIGNGTATVGTITVQPQT